MSKIDLNFYPEQHLDELEGMFDVVNELRAKGWSLHQIITALFEAKIMLWGELLHNDEDGNVWWG